MGLLQSKYPHDDFFDVAIIVLIVFFLFLFYNLYYHGVFHKVIVKATKPPFTKDIIVMYKFTSSYSESRTLLSEVQSLAPNIDSFTIYHNNTCETRSQVGASVGVILPDDVEEDLYRKLVDAKYKVAIFPSIDNAVVSSFPYRNQYSLSLAVHRVYPKLKQYIRMNRLCAHPIMEIYTKTQVHFVAPLSKQFDFYAYEAIPEYDCSSSENEEEEEYLCNKATNSRYPTRRSPLGKHCYCEPFLRSFACDKRKQAV